MSHITFNLLKGRSSATDLGSWGWGGGGGGTTEASKFHKISTKHCCFVLVRAIHATKTKIARKMSHSFGPFQFYTRKNLYQRYFSTVDCTPGKVIRHMTFDFDVCEVDLDMQMSFLNAAPLYNFCSERVNVMHSVTIPRLCFTNSLQWKLSCMLLALSNESILVEVTHLIQRPC